jgi:hypothetical protein
MRIISLFLLSLMLSFNVSAGDGANSGSSADDVAKMEAVKKFQRMQRLDQEYIEKDYWPEVQKAADTQDKEMLLRLQEAERTNEAVRNGPRKAVTRFGP